MMLPVMDARPPIARRRDCGQYAAPLTDASRNRDVPARRMATPR
jgi:hypothetical protein